MKAELLFCVLIIFMGETNHAVDAKNIHGDSTQRILLRKLQYYQNNPSDNKKNLTWNEILADVLVNTIRIFSFKTENVSTPAEEFHHNESGVSKFFSRVLLLYKELIYDKFIANKSQVKIVKRNPEEVTTRKATIINPEVSFGVIAKDEVELVGSRSGKNLEETTPRNVLCEDENSDCTNKGQKFILSIPNQCPLGFRPDYLGYCRPRF